MSSLPAISSMPKTGGDYVWVSRILSPPAAVVSNFGLCVLATLTFARMGLQTAGTIGLVSGNRNVTLVWAAASFGLPSLAEGYVAACVIPVLALPLIVKLCLKLPSFSRLLPQN